MRLRSSFRSDKYLKEDWYLIGYLHGLGYSAKDREPLRAISSLENEPKPLFTPNMTWYDMGFDDGWAARFEQ